MKFVSVFLALLLAGCGSSVTAPNVLSLTVNGTQCSSSQYVNEPCTSVQICPPGTGSCQTITGLLLDTGSTGLRIFSSAITVSLTQSTDSGNPVAECAVFGTGSTWGPVKTARVVMGGESAVTIPIQVIDSTFASVPGSCGTVETSPQSAGFNGILGLGLFPEDCGSSCAGHHALGTYYSCVGTVCTAITMALADQVQNPVSHLPTDNNGLLIYLPSVGLGGTKSLTGSLILGIGTQTNNRPGAVTEYPTDVTGEFHTTFNSTTYNSFLDSGSNGLFFTSPSAVTVPNCGSNPTWFCPSSTQSLTATNTGSPSSPSGSVSFQIGNFSTLTGTQTNAVFVELGGDGGGLFDFGLPFFMGRTVYIGISPSTSTLGTGPYWAY